MSTSRIILASQSPRRRQFLAEAGYCYEVRPPSDEAERAETPAMPAPELVQELALRKAGDVAAKLDRALVIGCDTVAEVHGRVLGKPADREDARDMLSLLRGQEHRVFSGLCLWERPSDRHAVQVATTVLYMAPLSDREIDQYLDSGAWQGKAGAFGYQDRPGWLRVVSGSESNVVGLPLELLADMLKEFER
ncbi:MAG: nucleoside triphosphate pyrophosphatase [Pirellulaceae bacterium]